MSFFKGKLFEAEGYIKELEDEGEASKRAVMELNGKLLRL